MIQLLPPTAILLMGLLVADPGDDIALRVQPALTFEPYCLLVGGDDVHSWAHTLDAVGDVDGDGVTDLAAFFHVRGPGRSRVSSFSIEQWVAVMSGATLRELWRDRVNATRACASEDLDGDGLSDVALACAHLWDGDRVEWRSGLSGKPSASLPRSSYNGRWGRTLVQGRDVDGDGRAELLVGSYGSVRASGGVCRLPRSAASGALEIVSPAPAPGVLASRTGRRCFGRDVCLVGDVTGDGLPEVATFETGPGLVARAGRVMLLSGDDLSLLAERASALATGNGHLSSIGDIDGDGIADLVLGRMGWWSIHIDERPASVAVLSGANLGLLRSHNEAIRGDSLGYEATDLGDLDGDGCPEYALASRGFTVLGREPAVYRSFAQVHSGRTGDLLGILNGVPEHEGWVDSIVALGDIDGDGRTEIALGLSRYTVDGEQRGAVLVVSVMKH